MGFAPYRADDVYHPGLVLEDIIEGLVESEAIVAEITPPNPNVFYELGYAHALRKPTILLAERGRELPFDIRGYRCIFYDNTIGGKKEVETSLRKHLASIQGPGMSPQTKALIADARQRVAPEARLLFPYRHQPPIAISIGPWNELLPATTPDDEHRLRRPSGQSRCSKR
jgi:hypothetical protein